MRTQGLDSQPILPRPVEARVRAYRPGPSIERVLDGRGVLALGPGRKFGAFIWAAAAVTGAGLAVLAAYRLPFDDLDWLGVAELVGAATLNGFLSAAFALLGQHFTEFRHRQAVGARDIHAPQQQDLDFGHWALLGRRPTAPA